MDNIRTYPEKRRVGFVPTRDLNETVSLFNRQVAIGARVRYWRGVKSGPPSGEGETAGPATVLGGHTAVVWVKDVAACIALSHVEVCQ